MPYSSSVSNHYHSKYRDILSALDAAGVNNPEAIERLREQSDNSYRMFF